MSEQTHGVSQGAFDLSQMATGAGTAPQMPRSASSETQVRPEAATPNTEAQPSVTVSAPLTLDVTEQNIDEELALSQTVPVVLILHAKNSLASKQAVELMESLARADAGAFQVGRIDVEESPNLAAAFQAKSVPAAFVVVAGRPAPLFEGVPTPAQATELLKEILQVAPQLGVTGRLAVEADDLETPTPKEHEGARAAEDSGDWNQAVKAWKKVLANNPGDKEAKIALARARFERRFEKENAALGTGADESPASLADSRFAAGDEQGAFQILLDALVSTSVPEEKEKLRKQLVGLFPISTDSAAVKSARSRLATHLLV